MLNFLYFSIFTINFCFNFPYILVFQSFVSYFLKFLSRFHFRISSINFFYINRIWIFFIKIIIVTITCSFSIWLNFKLLLTIFDIFFITYLLFLFKYLLLIIYYIILLIFYNYFATTHLITLNFILWIVITYFLFLILIVT